MTAKYHPKYLEWRAALDKLGIAKANYVDVKKLGGKADEALVAEKLRAAKEECNRLSREIESLP